MMADPASVVRRTSKDGCSGVFAEVETHLAQGAHAGSIQPEAFLAHRGAATGADPRSRGVYRPAGETVLVDLARVTREHHHSFQIEQFVQQVPVLPIVHFVAVVLPAAGAGVPGGEDVGRVDVVQCLRAVVRPHDIDRRPVLDQDALQALSDFRHLLRVLLPQRLGSAVLALGVDAEPGATLGDVGRPETHLRANDCPPRLLHRISGRLPCSFELAAGVGGEHQQARQLLACFLELENPEEVHDVPVQVVVDLRVGARLLH